MHAYTFIILKCTETDNMAGTQFLDVSRMHGIKHAV